MQTSIRLSLFSKGVKGTTEQSFNSSGSLFHKLAALNINERCPYVCLILGKDKFLLRTVSCFPGMDCVEYLKLLSNVDGQQTI